MRIEIYEQIIGELADGDWSGYVAAMAESIEKVKNQGPETWNQLIGLSKNRILVTPYGSDKGGLEKVDFFFLHPDGTGIKWEYSHGIYKYEKLNLQNGTVTYEYNGSVDSAETLPGNLASSIFDEAADGFPALIEAHASLEFGLHEGEIMHVAIASQDPEVGYLFHATVHTPAPQA